jgi:hypothetical protein
VIDDDERWVPGLLREHGYHGLQRQHGWHECLLWRDQERWVGHGADPAAALAHALAQMFPSAAARALFDAASGELSTAAASVVAAPVEPEASVLAAVTPAAPAIASTPAEPEPRGFETPKVGQRLILPLPAYPPAAVAEARETLDDILKEIADARPDFALMAPRHQKVHMLGWICRARGLDEQFAGEHKVTVLVRRVAHELTNISKIMWPGSVQALQMSARPDCVVGELGLKSLQLPRTWNDASEFVQQHRDRALVGDVPLDDYGWADDLRRVPPEDPRTLLREAQHAVEALGGPVQEPPPRHLTVAPEELSTESIEQLVKHVQQLRAIRIATLQPELWGCIIGRMRWLAGRLGDRAHTLKKWLDPEFRPPVDNSRATAQQHDQLRLRQQVVRHEREALLAEPVTASAELGAWLVKAFDAYNTPDVAALAEPLRAAVLALDDDALPEADRRLRRRLRDLKNHLRHTDGSAARVEGDEPEPLEVDDVGKPALVGDDDEPDDSLSALVRSRVDGKSALFVSNRDDPDLKARLEDRLGLDITWCDGNPRKVQAQCESIARRSYDLVLIATGFQAHTIDGILARAARAGGVPYVRVFKGRPLACVRALARSLGLQDTM